LARHGHRPILVERTGGLRTGGHAVDDFYFDEMGQVEMASWSAGRVALLGDAAFGPSRAVALPHGP